MSFIESFEQRLALHALVSEISEVTSFQQQTRDLVRLRTKEAQLIADGLQVHVPVELSRAHAEKVRCELATAKANTLVLIAKLRQTTYPDFLARGKADALAALQVLSADLDALANFPELPQAPTPGPTT